MLPVVALQETTAPERSAPPPKRGRLRRTFGSILASLGLTTVFACSALVSLGLHVNLPPLRRITRHVVNRILTTTLEGKVVVEDFDRLSLGDVEIRSVVAFDPAGHQTLRASGIKARMDVRTFAREAMAGNTLISLPSIQIDEVDVALDRGDDGRLGIEKTFLPKPRKRVTTTKKRTTPTTTKKTAIHLDHIEVGHASIHGNITAPRTLDAEVTRLVAAMHIGPDKLTIDVEPTTVRERGILPVEVSGSGDYHLHVDLPAPSAVATQPTPVVPRMWTGFKGQAGAVEVLAKASLDGQTITASIEVPRAEPMDLVTIVPGLPIQEQISVKASMDGTYPTFDLNARLDVTPKEGSPASVVVVGKLDVQSGPKVVLDVTTTDVNARAFRSDFPQSSVNARAHLSFAANPLPRFVVDASVDPTTVGGQSVPAIDAHAAFDHGRLEGRVTLHEPGAPTFVGFVVEGRELVRFETDTYVASFQAMPRLAAPMSAPPLSGSGRVRIRGAVRGGTDVDARVDGYVNSLVAKGGITLESGRFDGHVHGPVARLEMDTLITGERLRAGESTADRVTVRAKGPLTSPSVDAHLVGGDVEDLRASARIDPQSKSARNVDVRLSRGGEELRAKVAEVRAERGSVAARGVSLEGPGLGALGGTLVMANQEITGTLKGKGIDLSRLGRLFGVGKRTRGIADVDVVLARTNRGRKGHVNVNIKDATMAPMAGIEFPGTTASVQATFDDDRASLEASVRIDDHAKPGEDPATACEGTIAEVRISDAEASLRGPLLAASTWSKLSGHARVDAKDTRLDCVAKRLPLALLLTEIAGRLDASVSIERAVGQRFVSVKSLDVRTRGFKIAGPQRFGEDKPMWESRAMDVALTGSIDGATGATAAKVVLSDKAILGELTTNVTLDLRTLMDDPKRRRESLAKSSGTVTFSVPRRTVQSLESLPSILRDKLPPIDGAFSVTATASGTLEDPTLNARVSGWQLSHVDAERRPTEWSLPLDIDVVANYGAKKAGLVTQVRRHDREIASIVGNADIDLPAIAAGAEVAPNFELQTTLTRLPLGRLPYFIARGVEASVNGTLLVGQHGDQRTAKARFAVPALRMNSEVMLEHAALALDIEPSTSDLEASHGSVQVELGGKAGGHIQIAGYSGVNWSEWIPKVDERKPAGLSIRSQAFQLSSLQPLVTGVFSRIGGELAGELHVVSTMYGDEGRGYVESNMELTDGLVHIPQIGQELKNAHISIRSGDHGTLHFEDIRAEGISGRIQGSAIAKMKGLSFQGATADFTIDKSEALPITFEGVPLGHAYGKIAVVADKQPHEMHVLVNIPELHLALPASSTRAVQALEPHPEIGISHAVAPAKETRQSDALAWITTIELGAVQIEGMGADVKLTSPKGAPPRIELRQEARMSGDVQVVSGTFEVIGKKFEIERGLVRLREEDAGNPYVNITARWDAPNGSRVFVDYAGVLKPITEQKLRFRSDPPMSQQALLAMILSGGSSLSTGDNATEGSADAADLAANVVGGEIASSQINAVLSQIAPLRGLSTRVGTSDSGRLRTTVMYELGDTVKAQASYEGLPNGERLEGVQTQADDPSSSANRTEINIDWRFYKNWLLRGSFGFGGVNQQPSSGLDVLWQYRY